MYEWMYVSPSLPYMFAVHGSSSTEVGSRERRQTQPPDLTDRWRAMYPSQRWSGQVKRYSKANTLSRGVEALTGNVDYICMYIHENVGTFSAFLATGLGPPANFQNCLCTELDTSIRMQ